MEHALPNQDAVLAAFLEPGTLPELAKRVNMSLAALASWTSKHAELIEGVHKLLLARCKLIKAHLELSALTALATVSSSTTATDDPKLRERALERQRKAANAILRHKPGTAGIPACAPPPARGTGVPPVPTSPTSSASTNDQWQMPNAASSSAVSIPATPMPSSAHPTRKLSLSERLAARRLAALQTS